MCLAIPMKVVDVIDEFCTVEINEIRKRCYTGFLEERPRTGDYVLVHAGVAIRKIDEVEREEMLKDLRLLLEGEQF